jgi:putative toxin-antitoxin system antitoxin component (TIGR02293 family)
MSKSAALSRPRTRPLAEPASAPFSPEETLLRAIFGVAPDDVATKKALGNARPAGGQSNRDVAPVTAVKFVQAFRAAPMNRIRLIKQGISAKALEQMAKDMAIPKERLAVTLGLARATVDRKVRQNKPLSADEGSRVLGMASLIGQVQTMIEESGNPEGFNAAEWVARWIDRPLPALGGHRPAELMATCDGQALVSTVVARMQSGAYS